VADVFRSAWNNLTERFENKRLQVNSHLKTLFNVQSIAQKLGAALKELQRTFQGCLTSLKFSGVNFENWDPNLVYMCSTKLTLSLWEQSIQNQAEIPTWLKLDSCLTDCHRTLEAVVQSKDTNRVAEFPKINSFNTRLVLIPKGCDLCSKKNHPVRICPENVYVKRQFFPDVYISRARTAVRSPSPSLP